MILTEFSSKFSNTSSAPAFSNKIRAAFTCVSLVNVSTVTLYIHGQNLITGVMTDCKVKWDKPIGLDGYYLVCELSFTISEVSPEPLNYTTMRNKGLIG